MVSRITIYFESQELRKNLEAYSRKHRKSFSETVLEFAGAGFSLFQKTGSLNVDLLMERVSRLEEAKKEIEFLRGIIRDKTGEINRLLGVEKAPTEKPDLRAKSEGELPKAIPQAKPGHRRLDPAPPADEEK
jgi:hypothetical protein